MAGPITDPPQWRTLTLTDTIMAAVAIHNKLTLLTDNTRHFRMPQISLHPLPN